MYDASKVWPHFAPLSATEGDNARIMVQGEGAHLTDQRGRRYLDLLSSLYCVNAGHGRAEIGAAMAEQATKLAYYPAWGGAATPPTAALAERVAALAPDGFGRVFFTSGGSDSVDAAWKLARQYHRLRGNPSKYKIVAKQGAYHGTTMGALSVTGVPSLREAFEPLVPGAVHVPKVDAFHSRETPEEHSRQCAEALADTIESEGSGTVAAIIVEPVQNSGGCLVSEPVYFQRLREIADAHDVLLISDETICSWGRTGAYFGSQVLGYRPDVITTAKGLTSGYAPMGALIASNEVAEVFDAPGVYFNHGLTFGGHPVSAAAGLANLDIMHREALVERARAIGEYFRAKLQSLTELSIVGDVRGQAMFQAIELVRDNTTNTPLDGEERARLTEFLPGALIEGGIVCRAMHRGVPILQFAPPLVATEDELGEAVEILRSSLAGAQKIL